MRIAVVKRAVFAGLRNRESVVDPTLSILDEAACFNSIVLRMEGLALSCNDC